MKLTYSTIILLITQTLVTSLNFDPRIVKTAFDSETAILTAPVAHSFTALKPAAVNLRAQAILDEEGLKHILTELQSNKPLYSGLNLDDESQRIRLFNILKNSELNSDYTQLKNLLGFIPQQVIDRAILKGNLKGLDNMLDGIYNADLTKYIDAAASQGRLDMIVAIAKHGNKNTVEQAFEKVIFHDRSGKRKQYPRSYIGFLLRETEHVPGGFEAATNVYLKIMQSSYEPKHSLAYLFISNSNDEKAEVFMKALDTETKNKILLISSSKYKERVVRLFAESNDNLEFERVLQHFADANSWEFIISLSKYRPEEVLVTMLRNIHDKDHLMTVFDQYLTKINGLSTDSSLILAFKQVAGRGNIDLLVKVYSRLKEEMNHGENVMNSYVRNRFSAGAERKLFEEQPEPKFWIILEGIEYSFSRQKYEMTHTLMTAIDMSYANNIALSYAVVKNDKYFVQILLDRQQPTDGIKRAISYASPDPSDPIRKLLVEYKPNS